MSMFMLLVVIFIIIPVSNLFHELGHLAGALLIKAEHFNISVGSGRLLWTHTIGLLTINTYILFFLGASAGYVRTKAFSPKEIIWVSACGPLMNGLIAIAGYMALDWVPASYMLWLIVFNGWLAIVNLIPFKVRGKQSDGYIIATSLF